MKEVAPSWLLLPESGNRHHDMEQRPTSALIFGYWAVTLVLGALAVTAYLLLDQVIASGESSGALLNVAGRQRMLSQRVASLADQMVQEREYSQRDILRDMLAESIDLMERSHIGLTHGAPELGLPGTMSPELHAIYFGPPHHLDQVVRNFLERARSVASLPAAEFATDDGDVGFLVNASHSRLLMALDSAVSQYQRESDETTNTLHQIQLYVLIATLIALALSIFAVFRPLSGRIQSYLAAVIQANQEREKAAQEVMRLNQTLEARVRQRTAELEATNRELEAFTYSVSHDLRSPLRSLDGFSKVLLEDFSESLEETPRNYLVRIRKASQRMGQLIDDLLTLSRVSRRDMKTSAVDLSELGRHLAPGLAQRDPDRRVEVVVADDLRAEGDAGLFRVVLENLLGNAWKFTRNEAVGRIEFGRENHGEGAAETCFFVRDNGVGFDMAYVDKLFGPFQRLHGTEEFEGTGIGLATVQRIVLRHGGRVWAEGEVDQGSTIRFTLPTESRSPGLQGETP